MNVDAIKQAQKAVAKYRNMAPVGAVVPSKVWEGVKHEAPEQPKQKQESDESN